MDISLPTRGRAFRDLRLHFVAGPVSDALKMLHFVWQNVATRQNVHLTECMSPYLICKLNYLAAINGLQTLRIRKKTSFHDGLCDCTCCHLNKKCRKPRTLTLKVVADERRLPFQSSLSVLTKSSLSLCEQCGPMSTLVGGESAFFLK